MIPVWVQRNNNNAKHTLGEQNNSDPLEMPYSCHTSNLSERICVRNNISLIIMNLQTN